MTRHWEPGVGWVSDAPVRACRACGAEIPPRTGKGAPFRYCDAHAPRARARVARWQRANGDHLREYQRARDGSRPLVAVVCGSCGATFQTYTGATLCRRCRRSERP